MKLKVMIEEVVHPTTKVVTITFVGDKRNKKFEIMCSFQPFMIGMRKYDTWEMVIKFDSETIVLPDGTKTYQTFFTCDKAKSIEVVGNGK